MGTNYYLKRIPTQEEIERTKKLLDQRKIESRFGYFGYDPEKDMSAQDMINEMTKEIHIGKSSGGWQFVFRTNDEYYNHTIKELYKFIEDSINSGKWEFKDEYGDNMILSSFKDMVKSKKNEWNYQTYRFEHPDSYSYDNGSDFISEDGSWWCNVDFC